MNIRPGVWYTPEDVRAFRDDPALAGFVMRGYVLQQDPVSGNMRFVHESKAAMHAERPGNRWGMPTSVDIQEQKREILKPIQKRTPQQRMESLMAKVGPDLKDYLSGKAGREVTGEELRQVAQDTMTKVDKEFEERESKRITRTTGSPYA